jgi:hypothetical protein
MSFHALPTHVYDWGDVVFALQRWTYLLVCTYLRIYSYKLKYTLSRHAMQEQVVGQKYIQEIEKFRATVNLSSSEHSLLETIHPCINILGPASNRRWLSHLVYTIAIDIQLSALFWNNCQKVVVWYSTMLCCCIWAHWMENASNRHKILQYRIHTCLCSCKAQGCYASGVVVDVKLYLLLSLGPSFLHQVHGEHSL